MTDKYFQMNFYRRVFQIALKIIFRRCFGSWYLVHPLGYIWQWFGIGFDFDVWMGRRGGGLLVFATQSVSYA